ncbi:MAG: transcription termination/antitermination protein NusG [Bacteroidota bacterium]
MNWLAVYTKPRWEKKVAERIASKGLEVYCPLNKVRKKWSDRYKVIEEPLFKSYVFVRISEDDQIRVRLTDGVVNFVYSEGKPAQIREQEIDLIRRFLKEYKEVQLNPVVLMRGLKVRVKSGVLMDREGIILDIQNKKAYVLLESLGYELTASFELASLEPVIINQFA